MGIELFRGIAALMVLVTHYARFITTGDTSLAFLWTGVDMFFVISGFVFAPMLGGERVAVGPYLVRRFFRLYPLYAVAVCAYYFYTPEVPEKTWYFVRHLLFLHTTSSINEAYFFNPAFWSLPVEVEYYLLLPVLALAIRTPKQLGVLFLASLMLMMTVNFNRGPEVDAFRILGAHLTGILPEFMIGTFLYRAVQERVAADRSLLVAGTGVLIIVFEYLVRFGDLGLSDIRLINAPFNFMCALGYALIMYPVLLVKDTDYPPALARLAVFSGVVSYGVYLFHNLIPRILAGFGMTPAGYGFFLLSTVLTIVLAWLGYRVLENPARMYGRKLSRRMLHGGGERRVTPHPGTIGSK